MAQIQTQDPRYLIVGSGRLASHLQEYFSLISEQAQFSFTTWDRAQDPHLIKTKIHESTHVLLAISDSAIESFYNKHLAGLDKTVVHFSGALNISDLYCAHPLMTFGPEFYDLSFYRQIHFVITGAPALTEILPRIPNTFTHLPAEQKPLYHALCVSGGNFLSILAVEFIEELKKLGIPEQAAPNYLRMSLENALKFKREGLTGPLVRNDQLTIEKNLSALQNHHLRPIYLAFKKAWEEK